MVVYNSYIFKNLSKMKIEVFFITLTILKILSYIF